MWEDKWIDTWTLCFKFPGLFSISSDKTACLFQTGDWDNNKWIWKLEWRRTLFECEVGEENNLKQLIDDKTLSQGIGDQWVWKAGEKLIYTVSSAYRRLRMEVERDLRPLYEFFWTIKVLPSTMTTV